MGRSAVRPGPMAMVTSQSGRVAAESVAMGEGLPGLRYRFRLPPRKQPRLPPYGWGRPGGDMLGARWPLG